MRKTIICLLVLLVSLNTFTLASYGEENTTPAAAITTSTTATGLNATSANTTSTTATSTASTMTTEGKALNHSGFEVQVEPPSATIPVGFNGIYAVIVTSTDDREEDVNLEVSDLPSLVTGTFSVASGSPDPVFTSMLTVSVGQSAQPGTHNLTITAVREQERSSKSVILVIVSHVKTTHATTTTSTTEVTEISEETTATAQGFTIRADPLTAKIRHAGEPATYSIEVKALGDFDGKVVLGVHGLPEKALAIFNPSKGRPSPVFKSKLLVLTSHQTPPGVYSLMIFGAHGKQIHFAAVNLVIESAVTITTTSTPTQNGIQILRVSSLTTKYNYNPGDLVDIFGYVKTRFGLSVSEASVSIQVIDPMGDTIHAALAKTDGSGYYSNQFRLSTNSTAGTYTIYLTASKTEYLDGFSYNVFSVGQSPTPSVNIESLYTTYTNETEQEQFSPGQTLMIWIIVKNTGAELQNGRIWIEVVDSQGVPIAILVNVQNLKQGDLMKTGLQLTLNSKAALGEYRVNGFVSSGLISEGGKFLASEQTSFIVS